MSKNICLWDEEEDKEDNKLSDEQQCVVDSVCKKNNVNVIAKAGTGKTTTSLTVAKEFFNRHKLKTLLLTYNSSLKDETRARIKQQGLGKCIEAHSYHAAAYKFFDNQCCGGADDALIRNAIDETPKTTLNFGLLIVDEAQDMTDLYFEFVKHLLKHFTAPPVLLLLGDPFQQIFRYAGANIKYLTEPKLHFTQHIHPTPFVQHHLRTSYRITHEMAQFINDSLNPGNLKHALSAEVWNQYGPLVEGWWGEGIRANPDRKESPNSVIYQEVDFFNTKKFQSEIEMVDGHCQDGREQLAFLSKDMAGKAPINQVVERMSRTCNENCIVLRGDAHHDLNGKTRTQVMQQKLTFSTIHKFKGLERQTVVVCGMDHYYEKRNRDSDFFEHLDLFNVFYVACTRAKKQLIVWKHRGELDYVTKRKRPSGVQHNHFTYTCRVKDLFSYVPFDDVLSRPGHGLAAQEIKIDATFPDELEKIEFDAQDRLIDGRAPGTKEDISPILGVMVELLILRECKQNIPQYSYETILTSFQNSQESAKEIYEFLQNMYQKSRYETVDLARLAIAKFAIDSGFIHVWRQIDGESFCAWLKSHQTIVEGCVSNVQVMLAELLHVPCSWDALSPHIQFFNNVIVPFSFSWFIKQYNPFIVGQIDMLLDNGMLVELKVSTGLQMDHILQAQLYSSLLWKQKQINVTPVVMIANLGEMHQVNMSLAPLTPVITPHVELLYRVARRKLMLPFDPKQMEKDVKHYCNTKKRKAK